MSILLAGASTALIWALVTPEYRVSATLHVDPEGRMSLQAGGGDDTLFRRFAATEMVDVSSASVLRAAVNTAEVQSLSSIAGAPDAVEELHERLIIAPIEDTQLIEVAMTGSDPKGLATLVNAVVRSYIDHQQHHEQERQSQIVRSLTEERQATRARLAANQAELQQVITMRDAPGGLSVATIDTRVAQLHEEMTRLENERALTMSRLQQFRDRPDQGTSIDATDSEMEEFLARDADLRLLRAEKEQAQTKIRNDQRHGRLPSHPEYHSTLEDLKYFREQVSRRENELRLIFVTKMTQDKQVRLDEIATSTAVLDAELTQLQRHHAAISEQLRRSQELHDQRRLFEQDLDHIKQQIRKVTIEERRRSSVTIRSLATVPTMPNLDRRPQYTGAAILISLFLGTGVALVRHRSVRALVGPDHALQQLGMNVVGSIQSLAGDDVALHAIDRCLLNQIPTSAQNELASPTMRACSRMITSPTTSRGKSAFSMSLARALSSDGRHVLLIDGDPDGCRITKNMNLRGQLGLAELLQGTATTDEVVHITGHPNLSVLPVGKCAMRFCERFNDGSAQKVLHSLRHKFDEVIVDAPPVLAKCEAALLATLADEVLLVVDPGFEAARKAQQAEQFLVSVGGRVAGVVLNQAGV